MARMTHMPAPQDILPGRPDPIATASHHHVTNLPLKGPFSADDSKLARAYFALGCFWGAERLFWKLDGVVATSVGYADGTTPNPTYREVCSGLTGHTEVVEVVFDPAIIAYADLVRIFFENHNPTQGMRQGNDIGTQYRSMILTTDSGQAQEASAIMADYQIELRHHGHGSITTQIAPLRDYYYAEDYHQQYLSKNPDGYCGLGGTGVSCPTGITN